MKTTFITMYDYEGQPKSMITHETEADGLDDLIQAFEDHLRGCGFLIEGRLDIVNEEE